MIASRVVRPRMNILPTKRKNRNVLELWLLRRLNIPSENQHNSFQIALFSSARMLVVVVLVLLSILVYGIFLCELKKIIILTVE